jgi:hypothetical protein
MYRPRTLQEVDLRSILAAAVLVGVSLAATPAVQADAHCAKVLTASEVQAAAGAGFASVGEEEPEPGRSECVWLLERAQNPKAISIRFWRIAAAGGDPAKFFETQAAKAEQVHGNEREALSGIGQRAVLVPGKKPGAMTVVVLQTADGVAYVETDYVERAEVLGLARAVAAP